MLCRRFLPKRVEEKGKWYGVKGQQPRLGLGRMKFFRSDGWADFHAVKRKKLLFTSRGVRYRS